MQDTFKWKTLVYHFSIFILCVNVGLDSTLGWHQTNKSCAFIYAGLEPKRPVDSKDVIIIYYFLIVGIIESCCQQNKENSWWRCLYAIISKIVSCALIQFSSQQSKVFHKTNECGKTCHPIQTCYHSFVLWNTFDCWLLNWIKAQLTILDIMA
jgi:hypothetical protein